jgi:hypothetical protein
MKRRTLLDATLNGAGASIARLAASVLGVAIGLWGPAAKATEGAASFYFAGGFATFLTAVPPEPGFTAARR